MTTTVGELIERLKKMDRDEVVLCNLYSVANLRDCILGYMEPFLMLGSVVRIGLPAPFFSSQMESHRWH